LGGFFGKGERKKKRKEGDRTPKKLQWEGEGALKEKKKSMAQGHIFDSLTTNLIKRKWRKTRGQYLAGFLKREEGDFVNLLVEECTSKKRVVQRQKTSSGPNEVGKKQNTCGELGGNFIS